MNDSVFVDTNVLVYAIETEGPEALKGETAREVLRSADVTISAQVLGEFYCAVTRSRRARPLRH